MQWSDRMETGVKEADEQHKKLVSLVNELYDAMKQGKSKDILNKALNELVKYGVQHFNTEETLMTKYGFPGLAEHKKEHEAFKAKIKEIMDKQAKGETTVTMELMSFLKD